MNSYRKLCTEFYDIDKPQAPPDALAFYMHYATEANGPILEPMCGSGRFLIPLLERGFDVDGNDGSPHMLQACGERCQERGFKPNLSQQLLHQLEVTRQYNLILIPAGSFSLIIDTQEAREALSRLYAALSPGGKMVLEVEQLKSEESSSWPWGGRWIERSDGARIICSWLGHYDGAAHISYSLGRYELVQEGRLLETEFEDFNLRFYAPEEFSTMLTDTGFTLIQLYKTYKFSAPDDTDDTIAFACTKP